MSRLKSLSTKKLRSLATGSFLAALLVDFFSLFQKRLLGLSITFEPSDFLVPTLVGALSGLLLGLYRWNLQTSKEYLEDFLENASDLIQSVDSAGKFIYVNQAWLNALEYTHEDIKNLNLFDIIAPNELPHCETLFNSLKSSPSSSLKINSVFVSKHKKNVYVSGHVNCHKDPEGRLSTRGIFRDVSEHRKAEEHLKLTGQVFDTVSEAIFVADLSGKIVNINEAFLRLTEYAQIDVIGNSPHKFFPKTPSSSANTAPVYASLETDKPWQGETELKKKNGSTCSVFLTLSPILNHHGILTHYVGVFQDISERKQNEEQLRHLATHDPLTGLANKAFFTNQLLQKTQSVRANEQFAVFYLDLDNFKSINDTYGHSAGDAVLKFVAERMKNITRRDDIFARLGGDEFALLINNYGDRQTLNLIAVKLLEEISKPQLFEDMQLSVFASIGVSVFAPGQSAENLLSAADASMYQAKLAGKNTYRMNERLSHQHPTFALPPEPI